MAHQHTSGNSFIQTLANTAPKKQPSLKITRGFGTNDTRADQRRLASKIEAAQITAMNRLSRKKAIDAVSNVANLYMLEDTKSRAGAAYEQKDYVVVTREEGHKPDFGLIASRS